MLGANVAAEISDRIRHTNGVAKRSLIHHLCQIDYPLHAEAEAKGRIEGLKWALNQVRLLPLLFRSKKIQLI